MEFKELVEKTTQHLREELLAKRKHLFTLRSQAVTEKLEDPTQLRKTRKDIARILTAIHQREQQEKTPSATKAEASVDSGVERA